MTCPRHCGCDECLNPGGGVQMPGAGRTYPTEWAERPEWRQMAKVQTTREQKEIAEMKARIREATETMQASRGVL